MNRELYAVYNRTCGHVACASAERWMVERFVSAMVDAAQFGWRIRIATDADLEALARGDRCGQCTQDGQVTEGLS